jgi:hypothetical protein
VYGDGTDIGATNARTAAVIPSEVLRRAASRRWNLVARPLVGAGIAASVAAAAILFLRFQGGNEELVADATPVQNAVQTPSAVPAPAVVAINTMSGNGARTALVTSAQPDGYTTPLPGPSNNLAQNASLANYVVAHSEYSGPISRRMALLGILASETGAAAAQPGSTDAAPEATDAP